MATELDLVAIEHACMKLMVGYCVHADHGDADAFANVFAEDGAWVQGSGQEVRGRDALRAYIKGRPPRVFTRHVITNMLVDVISDQAATGVAYAVVFRDRDYGGDGPAPMPAPETVVEYRDEFRRTPEGWRIVRRRSIPAFC
jgi:uncharacterized protein (TIGR02246 family)